ncbi:putative RING-H2 finger protein ATL19 [Cajanus cajan]|uniref:RING-H2 finger protein ATL3G n=1 Tax=Cajanus cajan TaxID=3821 RepID=A0A151RIN6_CAJCA|nr:putative RING-H2 finger protein ATL19 [Cajanus cajan]KYP42351.1 RING-H2 finger protein ATL3G [Cajanus cajan]
MDHNNRVPRIHAFLPSTPSPPPPPPPSPPILSFIVALTIATLLFMCFYYFSAIISFAFLVVLYIITLLVCRFVSTDDGASPKKNQRVVRIFNRVFLVVEEKKGNHRPQQVKKFLLGSVVCFGSQTLASSPSLSCRECAICLEDFKMGEECLVFCVCGHIFHCDCINHWLREKPSCPICRHYVSSSSTTMVNNNSRSIEFLDNLV